MRMMTRTAVILSAGAVMVAPASVTGHASSTAAARPATSMDPVTAWNKYAGEAAVAACISPVGNPFHESRMYAMMHIAISDALNAIDSRYQQYAFRQSVPGASREAAVASAARNVLVPVLGRIPTTRRCIDAAVTGVQGRYTQEVNALPSSRAKTRGLALGRAAAHAIVTLRAHDGSNAPIADENYPQGTKPGEWRFTPGHPFAFAPHWGRVTPFALSSSWQYQPGPPYSVTSARYTKDYREVNALGGDGVTTPSARTPDQTEIARFWDESSPLRWNRISRTVAAARGLDVWEKARLFGLINIALADGYIAVIQAKYHYLFWRPVTAIRNAGTDGNPATRPNPAWTPLVTTPPIPDYPSGHAVEGGAGARVLVRVFGTDRMHFAVCSETLLAGSTCADRRPVVRRFSSFSQAAAENAVSRIFIGYHFRLATEVGNAFGKKIGDRAVTQVLRPVIR